MIDKALLGAIERALERNEPKEFIRHSLVSSGYSQQDVDEAIALALYRKQQAPELLQIQQPKQIQEVKQEPHSSIINKNTILIASLSLSLLIFIAFFFYILSINTSCNTLGLPTLKKSVLGLSVNCNQVSIIYIETWVAMLTTLALLIVVIYLFIKKKET